MDINKKVQSRIDCQTVIKYCATCFAKFNEYFVEFMQKRSNIVFQYMNGCQVSRETLKTSAFDLGFQHLPQDLANVNTCT